MKRYEAKPPVEAVRGLDLSVEVGECFGVLGPNGAGKTTTIEIIEGLLDATSGEVEVLGYQWGQHDDEIRQRLGISLQETRLSEKLSVLALARTHGAGEACLAIVRHSPSQMLRIRASAALGESRSGDFAADLLAAYPAQTPGVRRA